MFENKLSCFKNDAGKENTQTNTCFHPPGQGDEEKYYKENYLSEISKRFEKESINGV